MEDLISRNIMKLIASNYNVWRPQMEDLLNCNDPFDPLENEGVTPDELTDYLW